MENMLIKEWYLKEYADDIEGQNLNDDVRFIDLFECLDHYMDVYELLGNIDSLIRERIFEKLAKIMDVDYDYIYDQWLMGV